MRLAIVEGAKEVEHGSSHILRTVLIVMALASLGASYRTQNFVISAPTPRSRRADRQARRKISPRPGDALAGQDATQLAATLPDHRASGRFASAPAARTSFVFDQGQVFGWTMTIQGSLERILDSVLPHEVTHTVFADHFRRPLPRWADEGACTTVEHVSERSKQQQMLISFLPHRARDSIPCRCSP